jgi:hypothetical protein
VAAVVAVVVVVVVVVSQGGTEAAPSYIDRSIGTVGGSSVSSKVGTGVSCHSVGRVTQGPVFRCEGSSVDECWVVTDDQNITGRGVRPTL